jgi:predicted O-methyltransferase YrrM
MVEDGILKMKKTETTFKLLRNILSKNNFLTIDPARTKLFGDLIQLVKKDQMVFKNIFFTKENVLVRKIRHSFSMEQMTIENYWSNRISSSKNIVKEIKKFPFYSGYVSSAEFIGSILKRKFVQKPVKKILYVGSGALPLNPLLLFETTKIKIDAVERDPASYRASRDLIKKLDLQKSIKIFNKDIIDIKDLNKYDVVICAILVGENSIRREQYLNAIIKSMRKGAVLIIKNINFSRRILYPEVRFRKLKGLEIREIIEDDQQLTNLLILATKL